MHVRRLELTDFRSYHGVAVDFEPGPSVLVGPNGQGKTNLVEALGYLAHQSSHRVASDVPLVRAGAQRAVIRAAIVHSGRELLVELEIVPGKANRARLGRSPVSRPRAILGALKLVIFAPEDLSLIRGEPAERRRLLDDLLVSRFPRYAGVRADYDRVLKQRNALLRTAYLARKTGAGRGDLRTLEVWDAHLARHGAELLAGRLQLCQALAPYLERAYDAVSGSGSKPGRLGGSSKGKGAARVEYRSGLAEDGEPVTPDRGLLEARILAACAKSRDEEAARGSTLVGPHRDDLLLRLGELPAKGYASHGECWSYALALRLASYDLLRADAGPAPEPASAQPQPPADVEPAGVDSEPGAPASTEEVPVEPASVEPASAEAASQPEPGRRAEVDPYANSSGATEPVLVLDDVFAELDVDRRERLAELVGRAGQVLATCAVAGDVPEALQGARYDVAEGEVRRVR
ncbi:MAG: DNA replication/repair protein RecF [Micromonosporaceae bacterium]